MCSEPTLIIVQKLDHVVQTNPGSLPVEQQLKKFTGPYRNFPEHTQ